MGKLEAVVQAVQSGEESDAVAAAREAIRSGVPIGALIEALTAGMREIGQQFARMEIFLPEMILAAHAMQAVMDALEPELRLAALPAAKKGVAVIGTVQGDMHEIGKDIVIALMRAQGFEVHDLGINVNALDFVRKAEEAHADIIGASALMTTTMPAQKEIVELLKAKGLRDKYHVILGGAPVTGEWVKECGADSWGENAGVAVQILEQVIAKKGGA
jgi:corrinoid protein of di/trimethylamine methyltransferase